MTPPSDDRVAAEASAAPSDADRRRDALLPRLAEAFAAEGYDRTTTAALARAAGLRENQLYRLWPSKKAMFLDCLRFIRERDIAAWTDILDRHAGRPAEAIRHLLREEGRTRGHSGIHRITFAGLSRCDDPEIRDALRGLYLGLHRFITDTVAAHAAEADPDPDPDSEADDPLSPALAAWALIALGTFSNIGHELELFGRPTLKRLLADAGGRLLEP